MRLKGEAPIKFLEVSQLKDAIKALYNFRARIGLETEIVDDFRLLSKAEPPEDSKSTESIASKNKGFVEPVTSRLHTSFCSPDTLLRHGIYQDIIKHKQNH